MKTKSGLIGPTRQTLATQIARFGPPPLAISSPCGLDHPRPNYFHFLFSLCGPARSPLQPIPPFGSSLHSPRKNDLLLLFSRPFEAEGEDLRHQVLGILARERQVATDR